MPIGSRSRKKTTATETVVPSSGNVFADLELPQPELALIKAQLVQHIRSELEQRKLTQKQAAKLLGIDSTKVSSLTRGQVQRYSVDRLIRLLARLDQRVEVEVHPSPPTPRSTSPVRADT